MLSANQIAGFNLINLIDLINQLDFWYADIASRNTKVVNQILGFSNSYISRVTGSVSVLSCILREI